MFIGTIMEDALNGQFELSVGFTQLHVTVLSYHLLRGLFRSPSPASCLACFGQKVQMFVKESRLRFQCLKNYP